MYLLDASVVIQASEAYYPLDRVPEYWYWLSEEAKKGNIKIPEEILGEISPKDPLLNAWLKSNKEDLRLGDTSYQAKVQDIVDLYAPDLNEAEVENLGKDPFLVAAAMQLGAVVVTKEVSKPTRTRGNRHLPDVCKDAGVDCINDHQLIRDLDFKTGEKK